jgi:Flp pilus assembly protein TadB
MMSAREFRKKAELFARKKMEKIGISMNRPETSEANQTKKKFHSVNSILPKSGGGFFVGWFLGALLGADFLFGMLTGTVAGIGTFFFFWQWPIWKEKERMARVEAELPFVLLGISIELRLQRPFEKVLEKAGHSDFKFAGTEFQKASAEILFKGSSVPEALRHLSERLPGMDAKRAVIQLVHSYEQGTRKNRGLEVKRIANELLAKQRIQAKAFSGKLALFSLVFITVSAIAPALFQSFVLVGSTFLSLDFTPVQVLAITAIGFPAADLTVLLLIRFKTPVFLR